MPVIVSGRRSGDFSYFAAESEQLGAPEASNAWRPLIFANSVREPLQDGALDQLEQEMTRIHGNALSADRRSNSFIEVILPAPKWVSVLCGIATRSARSAVSEAHRSGVNAVFDAIERDYAWVRVRSARQSYFERGTDLRGVEFVHMTSRTQDPHLHSHLLLANSSQDSNSQRRALDGSTISWGADRLELVYLSALDARLRGAGVLSGLDSIDPSFGRLGSRYGNSEEVAKQIATSGVFSRRQEAILADMSVSSYSSSKARRVAAFKTREEKDPLLDFDRLRAQWIETSRRALSRSNDTEREVGAIRDGLCVEIASVKSRIRARDQKHGASLSTSSADDQVGHGYSTSRGSHGRWVLDEDVEDFMGVRPSRSPIGTGEKLRFSSPASRQRVYRADELAGLATAMDLFDKSRESLFESRFELGWGPEARFVLEDSMRDASERGGLYRVESDSGLAARTVGKALAGGLNVVGQGDHLPPGATVLVSASVSPGSLARLLSSPNSPRELHLVDQKRLEHSEGRPIGRGAGWRSWLREASATSIGSDCRPMSPKRLSPGIVVSQGSTSLVVHRSSAAMCADLASVGRQRPSHEQVTIVADAGLAVAVREVGRFPRDEGRDSLGLTPNSNFALASSSPPPGRTHDTFDSGLGGTVFAAGSPGALSGVEWHQNSGDLIKELADESCLTEAVVCYHEEVEVHVVEPITNRGIEAGSKLVVQTLASLGFVQDRDLLAALSPVLAEELHGHGARIADPTRISLAQLQLLNLEACRSLGAGSRAEDIGTVREDSGSLALSEMNLRLSTILGATGRLSGLDRNVGDSAEVLLERLDGVIKSLESRKDPDELGISGDMDGETGSQWLVRVAKTSLAARRKSLVRECEPGLLAPAKFGGGSRGSLLATVRKPSRPPLMTFNERVVETGRGL